MSRFQQNRHNILRVESELCPKVCKRLHREKVGNGRWLACWASDTKFEVKNGLQSFVVDLTKGVCNCRKRDITIIPCCHAVSCILFNRKQVEKYTNSCYQVSTYKACYEHTIDPFNGANMWTPTGLPPVQPPIKKRPPSRPKKKKALEPNEPMRDHSKGLSIAKRCKSYGKIGHNKRSCKCEVRGNSSLPSTQNQRRNRPNKTNDNGQAGEPNATSMPSN
nr:hypothetical protein CFP56_33062 [Quercus suber]